ncbi:MAG TPA: hypothetical protein VK688_12055 [Gemmatimonadales bacterium]|nr:hypothetical protein [Gemmatimonadales bacterium]
MPIQRLALGLSAINLVLLVSLLARGLAAAPRDTAPVLRGRALEIVDDGGKLRAQLVVLPPSKGPDGKPYPETVLFRLIDPNGRPAVKIGASVDGSGMSLAGDSERRDWSGVQILSETAGAQIKLTNRDGRVQVVQP